MNIYNSASFQYPTSGLHDYFQPAPTSAFPHFSHNSYSLHSFSNLHNPINPQKKLLASQYHFEEPDDEPEIIFLEPVKKQKLNPTPTVTKLTEPVDTYKNSHTAKLTIEDVFSSPARTKDNDLIEVSDDDDDCSIFSSRSSLSEEVIETENNNTVLNTVESYAHKASASKAIEIEAEYYKEENFHQEEFSHENLHLNSLASRLIYQQVPLNSGLVFPQMKHFPVSNDYFHALMGNSTKSVHHEQVHLEEAKSLMSQMLQMQQTARAAYRMNSGLENDFDSQHTASTSLGLDSRNNSAFENTDSNRTHKDFFGVLDENKNSDEESAPKKRGRGRPKKGELLEKKLKKPAKNMKKEDLKDQSELKKMKIKNNLVLQGGLFLLEGNETSENKIVEERQELLSVSEGIKKVVRLPKRKNAPVEEFAPCDRPTPIGNEYQVEIPPLQQRSERKKPTVKMVWNPEMQTQESLDSYIKELSRIVQTPVTNQEKALLLLKSFDNNTTDLYKVVKEDAELYRDLFKVKANKFRRCRMGY